MHIVIYLPTRVSTVRHPTIALGLTNLANLLHTTGRSTEAELLYREALHV